MCTLAMLKLSLHEKGVLITDGTEGIVEFTEFILYGIEFLGVFSGRTKDGEG